MRMSCNGCRVLRKGCSEDCSLRPCLQWLQSPESQANATSFLAKFYGRAGLINLLNAAANHLRPEIFKSLLYEACGRIINPVHGCVGLMHSGDWWRCQAAVESVLSGVPIMNQVFDHNNSSISDGDIRHLSKDFAISLNRVRTRNRVKRAKSQVDSSGTHYLTESEAKFTITGWDCSGDRGNFYDELERAPSHDSFSVEMVEASLVNDGQALTGDKSVNEFSEIGLELTLGINPLLHNFLSTVIEISDNEES